MNPSANSTLLYGGAVKLDFEAGRHTYTVTDALFPERGTRAVPSVTQILSIIDKSGPLTQWAANMTTEYIRAAIRPGMRYDEIQLGEIIEQARFNFRSVSREAKSVGSLAHEWIEGYLRNQISAVGGAEQPLPVNDQARSAIQAALDWIGKHFRPLCMEHRLYSRENEFAGTIDVFGEVDGQPAIVDWKASAAIYREFRLQTAAYASAWAEMIDDRVPDRWVIRLDKESGEFEAVKFPREEFRADLGGFLAAKRLHGHMDTLKLVTKRTAATKSVPAPPQAAPQPVPQPIQPRPMAPPPAMIPSLTMPAGPYARPSGRINGFAPEPRRSPRRARGASRVVTYRAEGNSVFVSGDTYAFRQTFKEIFRARGHKNGETFEWEMDPQHMPALAGLFAKAGVHFTQAAA